MNNDVQKRVVGRTEVEMHDIKLYDGLTARVPVGTILVKAFFDGWYQVMRCFVPRGGNYDPKADARRYISELRLLDVSVFMQIDEIYPAPKQERINPDGYEIPVELTDEADDEPAPENYE